MYITYILCLHLPSMDFIQGEDRYVHKIGNLSNEEISDDGFKLSLVATICFLSMDNLAGMRRCHISANGIRIVIMYVDFLQILFCMLNI